MARSGRYKVPFKRRRKGLTNYYKRKKLVLSGKPRLAIRKTNKYIIVQIIDARPEGDRILVAGHSSELAHKYGWKGDLNNTPAAYLTGFLAGLKAIKNGISEAIADIGLHRPVKGCRVFAALKGAVDAGLHVPHDKSIFPSEDRIKGLHIVNYAKNLKEIDPSAFERQFSKYIERGFDPENMPQHFEETLEKIKQSF
ncbi:MAG: 50S ribosomal protein L18 [Thermoproteales archaeon]|nr:50S ribosomal protein L18 [Thermoproteales archaeon]